MAPKKSAPSQNPISRRHSTSSPSSIPPSIHSKRQVILSNFPDTSLPDAFHSQGWASLCEKPLRCSEVFIQEFYSNMHAIDTVVPWFTTVFHGTHIVVTPELISDVLRVPKVDHPDYPSHEHLFSISRDELALLCCEKAMLWGGSLNFSTMKFAKGPRILNMVMTFVLTPQSHYNTITKPHAHFFSLSWRISL